jgi:hypothetical protein
MNLADPTARAALGRSVPPAGRRSMLRSVAMPTEHGGWSLTLEPVLLALLVAWSWPGFALGLAAMLAFVARTPVKVVLVDRWRHRWLDRTRLAARVAAVELIALVMLVMFAAFTADGRFWIPFVVAAPLIAVELWFDMRSRSRRLIPELAGTIGIGSVAAAIALADGAELLLALGLWCVVGARGAAAIPYVRAQVFRLHARPYHRWPSDLAQVLAVAAVAIGWAFDAVPFAAVIVLAIIGAINVAALRREPRPPKVLGVQQMMFGLAVTVVTAVAVLAA